LPADAIINKFNERVINGPDALVAAVWSSAPGDTVTLQYIDSAGSTQSLPVTLGQH
jgi:putative serine protease PepD